MAHSRVVQLLIAVILAIPITSFAQSDVKETSVVVNGHTGKILVYRINGQSFVELDALARIGKGVATFNGNSLVLKLPDASVSSTDDSTAEQTMTKGFVTAALKDVAIIKEWHTTIAHALQRGTPGDGSHLTAFHNRAVEALHLATVEASAPSDQNGLQLLTNYLNQVDRWQRKLIAERKSMSTGNYSLSPDSLDKDSEYQAIVNCSQSLGAMLAAGKYEDNPFCH